MPRSPLTWFVALAIILLHAVALFLQRKGDFPVMDSSLSATFVLVILLGWSATRDAPPFSDRAFHRTLPSGDGAAFRSVLAIHLLVLLGISLATAIYCAYFNFGWEAFGYGLTFRTLPLAVFMAIFGVGAAITSSPSKKRYLGLPLILGVPLFSLWVNPWKGLIGADPSGGASGGWLWLGGLQVLVTIFYLAVWWLVSVRNRKIFSMVAATIFGLWLPWIPEVSTRVARYMIKNPVEVAVVPPAEAPVKWHRKIFPDPEGDWIPVSQVLNVVGLKQGELARMKSLSFGAQSKKGWVWEVGMPREEGGSLDASIAKDGSLQWGRAAFVEALREQLPPFDYITQLHPDLDPSGPSVLMFKKPYDGPVGKGTSHLRTGYSMAEFRDERWKAEVEAFRYDLAGTMDLPFGGGCRASLGGRIFADIVKGEGPNPDSILVKYCTPITMGSHAWMNRGKEAPPSMMVMVDRGGTQAYAAKLVYNDSDQDRLWFGTVHRWSFQLTGRNAGLVQGLEGGRVYFFFPTEISRLRSESLPPPPGLPR